MESFRLAYDVYVSELNRFDERKLSQEQKDKRQKWDRWDFRTDTRHIVAMKEGKTIGRVRIIYDDMPLETDFAIPRRFVNGDTRTEVSKLMLRKHGRGTGLYLGLLRFVFHHVRDCSDLYISNLSKLDKFYGKMGFKKMGEFSNSELDDVYSAMHLHIPTFTTEPEKLESVGLDTRFSTLSPGFLSQKTRKLCRHFKKLFG